MRPDCLIWYADNTSSRAKTVLSEQLEPAYLVKDHAIGSIYHAADRSGFVHKLDDLRLDSQPGNRKILINASSIGNREIQFFWEPIRIKMTLLEAGCTLEIPTLIRHRAPVESPQQPHEHPIFRLHAN